MRLTGPRELACSMQHLFAANCMDTTRTATITEMLSESCWHRLGQRVTMYVATIETRFCTLAGSKDSRKASNSNCGRVQTGQVTGKLCANAQCSLAAAAHSMPAFYTPFKGESMLAAQNRGQKMRCAAGTLISAASRHTFAAWSFYTNSFRQRRDCSTEGL